MSDSPTNEINRLLEEIKSGSEGAKEALVERLYKLLKPVAHNFIRRENPGQTLHTTDLLHQTLIRANMLDPAAKDWKNKSHLLGYAALTMRAILVDRGRQKADRYRVDWEEIEEQEPDSKQPHEESDILENALRKLRRENDQAARIVVLRYYGGLTIDEVAEVLMTNRSKVKRDWDMAKKFLTNVLKL